jgi:hypothetical protein
MDNNYKLIQEENSDKINAELFGNDQKIYNYEDDFKENIYNSKVNVSLESITKNGVKEIK